MGSDWSEDILQLIGDRFVEFLDREDLDALLRHFCPWKRYFFSAFFWRFLCSRLLSRLLSLSTFVYAFLSLGCSAHALSPFSSLSLFVYLSFSLFGSHGWLRLVMGASTSTHEYIDLCGAFYRIMI